MNRDRRRTRQTEPRERIKWTRCPACRKRSYATEGDALVVAVRAAWSGTQRAYPCPRGQGWHLTNDGRGRL